MTIVSYKTKISQLNFYISLHFLFSQTRIYGTLKVKEKGSLISNETN